MELKKILEYQQKDMKVFKIEKDYLQMKEIENMKRIVKTYAAKSNELKQLEDSLNQALSDLSALSAKIDEIVSEKLMKINMDDLTDDRAFGDMYKLISQYDEEINALNKAVDKALKTISDIGYDNKRLNEEIIALNKEYAVNEAIKKKKEAEMADMLKPLSVELAKMRPEAFDADTFAKYSALRKAKTMPAVVPYMNGNCGACGIDIRIEVKDKLVAPGDIAECPNCGRILYIE